MKKEVAEYLKSGNVGVIPTDTILGLVGTALQKKVVERIYKVRKRNPKKPCIILIHDIKCLADFGVVCDKKVLSMLQKIWPAKITVILTCASKEFAYLHRGTKKLAFRIPGQITLRTTLSKSGSLIAPSANFEGEKVAETIEEAKVYFGDSVDFYVKERKTKSMPSTIIEIKNDGVVTLVREGAVSFTKILSKLKTAIS